MELEDFITSYSGKIEAPIGKKILYFKYLLHEINDIFEPVLAWMKTDDNVWHRFFLDACIPHWEALNSAQALQYAKDSGEDSIEEIIKEELTAYADDEGAKWKVIDVLELNNLLNKEIVNVSVTYLKKYDNVAAQLELLIEDNKIVINDFCDIIEAELIINDKKITA